MTALTVHTQAELDAALNDPNVAYYNTEIIIDSPAGVTLVVDDGRGHRVSAYGSSTVHARGSSAVTAFGSSAVIAFGSSAVHARGSSTVHAFGSSAVHAYDSSTVTAYGSSAVTACDSSTVTSYGSSAVTARGSSAVHAYDSSAVSSYDSSTVTAFDSSTVAAYDSSAVTACDSSAVTARDSSTVHAYDSSTVHADDSVAIHEHGPHATIAGGVIIDHTTADALTPTEWAAKNGAPVKDGMVTLYKALPADLTTGRPFGHAVVWPTTGEVSCDDWRDDDECGGGLHLSPTPGQAWPYLRYETSPRFLECTAPLDSIVPIPGESAKCKTPSVTVLREVDLAGRHVAVEEVAR